ncbi:FAD dependent oxidoreductase [Hygrophoropsis aurantiaca]|uniref:FAD dependent oxidoreductase n=1 Tax=Hygrophoropsis aurantiaca TaxID=72124 RepID=A0ACB8AAR2_9AGAM|nr:FAD dependent oxidoreductase [Hygrophoropsis aurantiaca]
MGNTLSLLSLALHDFFATLNTYRTLKQRVLLSPGLPHPNPTQPFWTVPTSPIARYESALPEYADYVVIGSGITGTAFVRSLFRRMGDNGAGVKVLMLDARDACSGATGRNGGHITPPLHHDYATLLEKYGPDAAKALIRFRLAHLHAVRAAAAEVPRLLAASQWREVETVDVFYHRGEFEKAAGKLEKWKADMPDEAQGHRVWEGREAAAKFGIAEDVVGCISSNAGAMHPYRFVTGLLAHLLDKYPENFYLCTNTPCTSILPPTPSVPFYTAMTPSGIVRTPHVIHATNAWASHLLEPLRAKIVPFRGNMSAQRPGQGLSRLSPSPDSGASPSSNTPGYRSHIFYTSPIGYDYLTQLPGTEHAMTACGDGYEMMLGGGFEKDVEEGLANADDSACSEKIGVHLGGVLPRYFGAKNWGAEGCRGEDEDKRSGNDEEAQWNAGRVKALWSGILGISVDLLPWVGRIPPHISGRAEPPANSPVKSPPDSKIETKMATPVSTNSASSSSPSPKSESGLRVSMGSPPGEWIAAGYSGEGMVHAWLCGTALAGQVLGSAEHLRGQTAGAEADGGGGHLDRKADEEWDVIFPAGIMSVSEKRWKKAKVEGLLELFEH